MTGTLLRRALRLALLLFWTPYLVLVRVLEALARGDVLALRLTGRVADWSHEPPWKRFLPGYRPRTSLEDALEALELVRAERRTRGVLLELDRAELSLVQAEALADALDAVRRAGKKVTVWADGTTAPALVVGAAADRSLGSPEAQLMFLGVRVRALFVHGLLETFGVVAELDHEGQFKTAAHMFTKEEMTAPQRENLAALGGDLQDQVLARLVVGRSLERAAVTALLDDAPVAHRTAVEGRLLDGVAYRDELEDRAGEAAGCEDDPRVYGPGRLLARARRREWVADSVREPPFVVVAPVHGVIGPGEEGRGCPVQAVGEVLDALREDARVAAVVLDIDSPGGGAAASDDLWRSVRRLDEEKPVVARLNRVAASGGYYAAAAARRIVAHAATITGSIGVIAGKLHAGPALERWGVRLEGISFGARAGMYDPDRGFDEGERAAARRELLRFYRTFLERVAEGRKLPIDEVERLAQGRVYTGRQALAAKLVDRLGGLDAAVEEARKLAGLTVPHRLARASLPRRGWTGLVGGEAGDALGLLQDGLVLARERVLALCPWVVDA